MVFSARIRTYIYWFYPSFHDNNAMTTSHSDADDLIDHLCRHSPLTAEQARKIVVEVNNYYRESVATFVRRRHKELQRLRNDLTSSLIYDTKQRRKTCLGQIPKAMAADLRSL